MVPWGQDDPSGLLALTGVVPLIAIVVGAWALISTSLAEPGCQGPHQAASEAPTQPL